MCLSKITKICNPPEARERTVYKVVIRYGESGSYQFVNLYFSPEYGKGGRMVVPHGRWLTAVITRLDSYNDVDKYQEYSSGFHCFPLRRNAYQYAGLIDGSTICIIPVRVQNVTTYGVQDPNLRCVVAQRILYPDPNTLDYTPVHGIYVARPKRHAPVGIQQVLKN